MRVFDGISKFGLRFIVAAALLLGGCGIGLCETPNETMLKLREEFDRLVLVDHQKAKECLERMMRLWNEAEIDDDSKSWFATALIDRGDYAFNHELNIADAVKYYMMAHRIIASQESPKDSVKWSITRRVVRLLQMGGDYDEAIALGEALVRDALGKEVSETTLYYVLELAEIYLKAGRAEDAHELIGRYHYYLLTCLPTSNKLAILEARIGLELGEYEGVVQSLQFHMHRELRKDQRMWGQRYLAMAYSHIGDRRMVDYSDSINHTTKQLITAQLSQISPSQRKNWLLMCDEAIDWQLSLPDNPHAVRNGAELLLYRKSLMYRTSAEIRRTLAKIPANREILAQIDSLRHLTGKDFAHEKDIQKRVDSLNQALAIKYIEPGNLLTGTDIKLDDIFSQLSNKDIVIDFYKGGTHGQYAIGAFIYSKKREPVFVKLLQYSDSISAANLKTIHRRLAKYLVGCKNVYFSTDGPLSSFPIEFYNTHPECNWHRLFHLASIPSKSMIGKRPVLIGVSDHNSPIGSAEAINRADWIDLQSTKVEIETVSRVLKRLKPTILFNDDAREGAVKRLAGSDVSLLHFSTHGFYRDEDALNQAAMDSTHFDHQMAKRALQADKTELSGLAMRGGNHSWKGEMIDAEEDDLLTSEEIEAMNFPDLKLVVLSACETGLGQTDSEGVWGLQRAFRIAGCKSLICSLRKVDDYWTAQFMEEFYKNAVRGMTIYDSFHSARKTLLDTPECPRELLTSFILIE